LMLNLVSAGPANPVVPDNEKQVISFKAWLSVLRKEALAKGISEETLNKTLPFIKPPIKKVVKLDRNQPEFKLTFEQYLNRVVPASRVKQGRKLLKKYHKLLSAIEAKYGVQARFLIAFWGMETSYGRLTGGFNALDALATLAYDGRRAKYFRRELINALKIIDAGHVEPKNMTASWAGAMGQTQFMPSTFLSYATDFNGDGKINIWHDVADALASGANYLSSIGWNHKRTWGREVLLPKNMDKSLISLKVKKKIAQWQQLGVRRVSGEDLPRVAIDASIIQMDDKIGRAYMVYDNYRAIMDWNRSMNFATAVGILSDKIGGR
ncbi:MAG TPA: lytic murein transglycosylase, partial [Gammaproteobacteria bacterium]|nr:lytic murein transglycosylase [Gammaproteobacteria bacterium]